MDKWDDFNHELLSCDIVDFEEKVPIGVCIQCKRFGANETNKCSYCISGIIKCTKCKSFYTKPYELYCSGCNVALLYNGVNLTIKQILDLPDCPFKGIQINDHLEEIFNDFKTKTGIKYKLIKNVNEFKILLNQCKDKSSGEIFCILDGQRNFVFCSLPAKFADQLLDQCMQSNVDPHEYRYVHAIAPFIYDIWNFPSKNSVLDCYYREFGELNKCPSNIKDLYSLWGRCMNPFAINNLTNVDLCKCVCGETIELHDKKIKCSSCFGYIHKYCLTGKCPMCNADWLSESAKNKFFSGMCVI